MIVDRLSDMDDFLAQLRLELEDIEQDLACPGLRRSCHSAADFGCGAGLTTISLLLELGTPELQGIDKDARLIQAAKDGMEGLRLSLLSGEAEDSEDQLIARLRVALESGRSVSFSIGDIISPHGLPRNLDLAFCRRVLIPIHDNEYSNPVSGMIAAQRAIKNIAATVTPGGQMLIVEKHVVDFRPALEKAGLDLQQFDCYGRGDIGTSKRVTLYETRYVRYLCTRL